MKKVVFWSIATVLSLCGTAWAGSKVGEWLGTQLEDAILEMEAMKS